MPTVDKPLSELREYRGINPKPDDFDSFWDRALAELDATPPEVECTPVDVFDSGRILTSDLTFQGVGGARIYAKCLRPGKGIEPSGRGLLVFHGYAGSSGDWCEKLPYVAAGMVVVALDCRGQGGRSEDSGGTTGNTFHGHIIRGLDDHPDQLLFRKIFLDTVQLARVVAALPEVDELYCMGGSQGGALSIACAALEPRIRKCVAIFPFLSDFRRVWEMDLAKDAYAELKSYLRIFDPLHEREDEIFTKLGYIDVHHLAPRISADVLMGLTLMDTTCPPSTQFAVFNSITSKKDCLIYPDHGHEGLPGFPDRAFRFLARD